VGGRLITQTALPLQDFCDELVEQLVHGRPEDDIALVAIRLAAPAARA
jgi:hypothetical protein